MDIKTPTKRPLDTADSSLSPQFMKPSEVFKRRISRKTNVSMKFSPSKATAAVRRCKLPIETVEKLYSPLKCLQPKILKISDSPEKANRCRQQITFSPLMKKLQRSPIQNQISFPVIKRNLNTGSANGSSKRNFNALNRVLNFSEDAQLPEFFKTKNLSNSSSFHPLNTPNIDWSLKTRMRIVINCSIPFHGIFNSIDEATGINNFVRGTDHSKENNFCAELQRHCLVWQHPYLPWMCLFPRQPELKPGSSLSSTGPPVFTISPSGALADSLHSNFCLSLHSIFKLLKSKYCPYFYLCANNFVALFRASGLVGSDEAHVLISPTTIGFRRLLEEEGVKYQMPFHNNSNKVQDKQDENSKTSESSSGIEPDIEEDNDDDDAIQIIDDPEESNQWLESLGLSQQDFPSLETSSFRRRRQLIGKRTKKKIDDQSAQGKVKSLIRINGILQLQSLLGLFINFRKICISTSGPLAGIPPTLLAPVSFHGATLVPITVEHKTTISNNELNQPVNHSSLDFNGPILPHTVYGIMNLFRRFLEDSSPCTSILPIIRSTLKTYDPSSSFALEAGLQSKNNSSKDSSSQTLTFNPTFSVENLEESGMDRKFLKAICTVDRQIATPLIDYELSSHGIRYNRFILTNNTRLNSDTSTKFTSVFGSIS